MQNFDVEKESDAHEALDIIEILNFGNIQ